MFSAAYDHTIRSYARAKVPTVSDTAQWEWELDQLLGAYRLTVPLVTVELGVYQGGTLFQWLRFAPKGSHVIGIDQDPALPQFAAWAEQYGVRFDYIVGNTHDPDTLRRLQDLLEERQIDFLFIDAEHTEPGVTQDFEDYGALVRPGGLIALHDILDPHPSRNQDHVRVSRLWERIRRAGYLTRELVAHPDQEWGGIGMVSP